MPEITTCEQYVIAQLDSALNELEDAKKQLEEAKMDYEMTKNELDYIKSCLRMYLEEGVNELRFKPIVEKDDFVSYSTMRALLK